MLPARLDAIRHELAPSTDNQCIAYYDATWRRLFADDLDYNTIAGRFPGKITRGDLRQLSKAVASDRSHVRQLFLATMIWGFGTVGYGAYRTRKMLDAPQAPQVLARTAESIHAGRLDEAYRNFQLPLCGPAFFTKFFYALGMACDCRPRPLVLDRLVARSLRLVLADMGVEQTRYTHGEGAVTWYPQGYVRYLEDVADWATTLGCSEDVIEMALFAPSQTFLQWQPEQ